ncbi:DinB family protein [Nocardioides humilatus]|uniref:DinB family protein n=1 Tax=Nocardioides humilatus TaxID=2607660 RepID=A0A5B1LFS0_9ACTN|nr:DinB family protein [Nocardioides humilatus]KAA1419276.1 DinB family protein [Nocardioides humilatus]
MTTFRSSDDLRGAEFLDADLTGARFVGSDLSGAVMRGVVVDGAEIDAPWLSEGAFLLVNGIDVLPFVEAELDRQFPGRADRKAADPVGLRAAWAALERAWGAAVERARSLPGGTVDVRVAGEWSFAQTLRHLVLATDLWLGQAVLEIEQPFHPLGLRHTDADDRADPPPGGTPTFAEVLQARASRIAMVRDFLVRVSADELAAPRTNPHSVDEQETVVSCLHVILEEEWEHLRYALRDLDVIAAGDQA